MSRFLQLHLLTSYPPSNLNRDDLGRPKTAYLGGRQRLRISSQCLKRRWRTSDLFQEALGSHMGTRTKEMGRNIYQRLRDEGVGKNDASDWAKKIIDPFGKRKRSRKDDPLRHLELEQLAHFSPEERAAINELVETIAEEEREPTDEELDLLRGDHKAVDIGLFGRMMASNNQYNDDGAVDVAHAITVHEAEVETDYFSAVDDLNAGFMAAVDELNAADAPGNGSDQGAAHLGEKEFGAGVFYLYIHVNRDLLVYNLEEDEALADTALRALTESAATVAPSGMQSSYGSHARASYVMAEKGDQQPRNLASAFLRPFDGEDPLAEAVDRLETTCERMDRAYGPAADERYVLDVMGERGTLNDLLTFVAPQAEVTK
jgi:CRISPR system Cascade subunit CasC